MMKLKSRKTRGKENHNNNIAYPIINPVIPSKLYNLSFNFCILKSPLKFSSEFYDFADDADGEVRNLIGGVELRFVCWVEGDEG